MLSALAVGCSTAANGTSGDTGEPPPPDIPVDFDPNGLYVHCDSGQVTCMKSGFLGCLEYHASERYMHSLSLVTDGGGSTGLGGNVGLIDFAFEKCEGAGKNKNKCEEACAITINSVSVLHELHEGVFTDADGSPHPYTIDGVNVSLVSPVTGIIDPVREVVTFPSESFTVSVTTGAVTFDGMPFPAIDGQFFEIDQVVGKLRNGILTLNIAFNTIDADVAICLTTTEKAKADTKGKKGKKGKKDKKDK